MTSNVPVMKNSNLVTVLYRTLFMSIKSSPLARVQILQNDLSKFSAYAPDVLYVSYILYLSDVFVYHLCKSLLNHLS